MNSKWLAGLKDKDKNTTRADIITALPALQRLKEILKADLETSIKNCTAEANFEEPAWDYKQAFKLGEQKAYRQILNLIEVEDTTYGNTEEEKGNS